MIRITSRKDGFRRAGLAHSAQPTDYPNDAFSPKQLAALKAEPMLVVQELPDPKAKSKGEDDDKDNDKDNDDDKKKKGK